MNYENFIRANTRLQRVPLAPEISLHLADDSTALWHLTEEALEKTGLPPPFWAFAWAGGQPLARHVLDHPELVCGKRVLDFAAGSGLAGIAAAMAGAAQVEAVDIDPFAIAAIALNSAANGVVLDARAADIVGEEGGWDVVLAGDIAYERDTAARVTAWLERLAEAGALVLIGDPGRSYLARQKLAAVASYAVPVTRDLEDCEVKTGIVYVFRQCERGDATQSLPQSEQHEGWVASLERNNLLSR